MPPRRRNPDAGGARPAASVKGAEDAVEETSLGGRSTADGGTGPAARSRTDPLVTQQTGEPGGRPDGHPTRIKPGEDAAVRRSLERENDGATILAASGYRVKQNPSRDEVDQARLDTGDTGNSKSKPDYLVEGRVFDCYSPDATKPVRGVHWEVADKVVRKQQTQRMVVNLADWAGDISALRKQFADWPVPGLKELKVITRDGEIVQIPLAPAEG